MRRSATGYGLLGGAVCGIVATVMLAGSTVALAAPTAPAAPAAPAVSAVPSAPPARPPAAASPAEPPPGPGGGSSADAGADTSAATALGWGEPDRVDEFDGATLSDQWEPYDGPGHNGAGRRSPGAFTVKDGVLTVDGTADGTTGGMAWNPGRRYGRWEARVRSPAGDPTYHPVLLLWPDAENWPVGGEVDFMEISDATRQTTDMFLHYGEDNSQVQGDVTLDATQWHDWAVEWTPDHIAAFVDGRQWWRTDDTGILPPGPMHLTIQLDWFPEGDGEVRASQMQVDWVKQYPVDGEDPATRTP